MTRGAQILTILWMAWGWTTTLAAPGAAHPPVRTTVRIPSGQIEGFPYGEPAIGLRFLGIPYAAPPIGARRWTAPSPAPAWSGVRTGAAFGAACPQSPSATATYSARLARNATLPGRGYFMPFRTDEDCLYLNVWTADLKPRVRTPVVVYIHGGGNTEGAGQIESIGHTFVPRGVTVVTFNFRLGALGFLAHPRLSAESPRQVSGNYGLLDMLAALDWVQANIAAFGGDPQQVTLMGESAGASDIYMLLASPLVRGKIRRAILQSGSAGIDVLPSLRRRAPFTGGSESAEDDGLALAHDLGIEDGPDALDQLRALPALEVLAAEGRNPALQAIGPNVDGWVLPQQPGTAFVAGSQLHVPILVGSNTNEARMFRDGPQSREELEGLAKMMLHDGARDALALHPLSEGAPVAQAFEALTEAVGAAGGHWVAAQMREIGVPACYYHFSYPAKGERAAWGAYHWLELLFLGGEFVPEHWGEATPADLAFADTLVGIWTRFVKSGDPGAPGLPPWDCRAPGATEAYELGVHLGPIPTPRLKDALTMEAILRANLTKADAARRDGSSSR